MFETKPALKTGKKLEKPADRQQTSDEKKERLEYHKQIMEVVLESAEKVLWENPKLGMPDLVEKIFEPVYALGAEPSPKQRKWVGEKVQQWIDDVGDELEAIKYLYLYAHVPFVEVAEAMKQDAPWLLLETDERIKAQLLRYLPVENKEPRRYIFHADRPPFLVIECLDSKDYQYFSPFDEGTPGFSTNGIAKPKGSFLVPLLPDELKGFEGSIAIMRGNAGNKTKVHETQHLLYGRYIVDEKAEDVRAIDELAAYLKTGEYRFDESAIFSDKRHDRFFLQEKKYDPDWQRVKMALLGLNNHGFAPSDLWSKVATSDDLPDLAERLERLESDDAVVSAGPGQVEAIVQSRPFIQWFLHAHDHIEKSVAEELARSVDRGVGWIGLIGLMGEDFSDILEGYRNNRGTNSAFGNSHYDVMEAVLMEMEFCTKKMAEVLPTVKTSYHKVMDDEVILLNISGATLKNLFACVQADFPSADKICESFWPKISNGTMMSVGEEAEFVRRLREAIALTRKSHEFRQRLKYYRIDDRNFARLASERLHIANFDDMEYSKKLTVLADLYVDAALVKDEFDSLIERASIMEEKLLRGEWEVERLGLGCAMWYDQDEDIHTFFEKYKVKFAELERKFAEELPGEKVEWESE